MACDGYRFRRKTWILSWPRGIEASSLCDRETWLLGAYSKGFRAPEAKADDRNAPFGGGVLEGIEELTVLFDQISKKTV